MSVQVQAVRVLEVHPFLDGRQIDNAEFPDIVGVVFLHDLAGALHDPHDAGLADKHVVRFFGQHETAGTRQRVEAAFRQ